MFVDPSMARGYEGLHDSEVREFSGEDGEVAFPLGGIGTGNVSLGARGDLRDWEIFNRPAKGNELPYSFFALWCERPDGEPATRVLESRLRPPHQRPGGYPPSSTGGLPRFDETTFRGEYPVADIEFRDDEIPIDASLTAYTPCIPLDPEDSGIPVAVLEYTVENPTDEPLAASVAGSLANPVGHREEFEPGGHRNAFRDDGVAGIKYSAETFDADSLGHGEAALATTASGEVTHTAAWERSGWWDAYRAFGEDFRADGRLTANSYDEPSEDGETDVGSLAVRHTLDPGESTTVRFLLTWYFPNRPRSWDQSADTGCCGPAERTRNHYATRFSGAWDVADYVSENLDRLRGRTFEFRDAFFGSTLPGHVLEAVSSQIAVARSTTCLWLEDGTFLGFEGCDRGSGCCQGTCTHVWNYAWTLAALFPSLEREMRRVDLEEGTDEDGYMSYRTPLPFGSEPLREYHDAAPAVDGQMGTVMRLYREWTRSGDGDFLEALWPHARRALEFAFDHEEWDPDEDGLLEGEQHNTYDIEFYGPNPLSQSWYLGALAAGAEMARAVGEEAAAERYEAALDAGREATDDRLWNGSYFEQAVDDVDEHRYQHGRGCLSDQLLGQWYATQLGLGDLLPPDHVRGALDAIYEHNFRTDLSEHVNYQRTYALNDEAGLLLCSWPEGGEPAYPFVYSDEVWTGIEYQVASHLIREDRAEEGLAVVRAVRERHDGEKRNPWNEFECGNHYARAMASWAVYESLCGVTVDLTGRTGDVNGEGFAVDPAVDPPEGEFRCFWVTGDAWGTYAEDGDGDDADITVCYER
jgi:uncharacterized protein (DUF608 family)